MIETVQSVKQTTREPYASVCRELDVDYSSLMRWKSRQAAGETLVQKPGPGKVGPLDLPALTADIRLLAHGRERTRGTGALYALHHEEISRRDLNHVRRPVLGHRTACQTLESGRPVLRQYHRRKRKEAFEEIKALAVDIAANLEQHTGMGAEVAFRYAAESWMQSNNIIRVRRNGQVLPTSYRFQSH